VFEHPQWRHFQTRRAPFIESPAFSSKTGDA